MSLSTLDSVRRFFAPYGERVNIAGLGNGDVSIDAHIPGVVPLFPGSLNEADDYWWRAMVSTVAPGRFRVTVQSRKGDVSVVEVDDLVGKLQEMYPEGILGDPNKSHVISRAVPLACKSHMARHMDFIVAGVLGGLNMVGDFTDEEQALVRTLLVEVVAEEIGRAVYPQ